jgi:hypothetical protein
MGLADSPLFSPVEIALKWILTGPANQVAAEGDSAPVFTAGCVKLFSRFSAVVEQRFCN